MKTSESVGAIAKALLAAQKVITFAAKDTANPFFKSKYADLPCVIDAIKNPLNDNGIVFIQSASPSQDGFISMTTRLLHESGEWIEDTATLPLVKNDPQGYGSASTYARRYGLAAITGLYQDDDDGNAACRNKPAPAHVPPSYISAAQVANITALADEVNADMPKLMAYFKVIALEQIQMLQYPQVIAALEKKRVAA